jgi:hypothetical protein
MTGVVPNPVIQRKSVLVLLVLKADIYLLTLAEHFDR